MNPEAGWFAIDPSLASVAWFGAMLLLGSAVASWLATACCLCWLCRGERRPRRAAIRSSLTVS